MEAAPRILYCHCAHAQVVPDEVKRAVLRQLSDAGVAFEAVADLCEMSARRDPSLQRLAAAGPVKIAACYPRAVKWLFAAAQAPLLSATDDQRLECGTADAGRDAVAWAREAESRGAGEILLTSMDADGTGEGYDLALTRAVSDAVSVPVIASGEIGRAHV